MKRTYSIVILAAILLISIGGVSSQYEEFLTGEEALAHFKKEVIPMLIQIALDKNIKAELAKRDGDTRVYDVMTFAYQQALGRVNLRRGFVTKQYNLLTPPGYKVEYIRDEIVFQLCLWSFFPWCNKEPTGKRLAEQVRTAGMDNSLGNFLLNLAFKGAFFELSSQRVSQLVEVEKRQQFDDYVNVEAFYQVLSEIKEEFNEALKD